MEPANLSAYKSQVYNPGSANPNPEILPFKSFPKSPQFDLASVDPNNPLKIVLSTKRKRKSVAEVDSSPVCSKKIKMMSTEQCETFFEGLSKRFTDAQDSANLRFNNAQEKVNNKMTDELSNIHNQLTKINDSQIKAAKDTLEFKETTDDRIKSLEDNLVHLKTSLSKSGQANVHPEALENAVKHYVDNSSVASWKANLAKDVFEHEHGIVIHGLRLTGANDLAKRDAIKAFLKDKMKASDDLINKIRIKEVARLGADNEVGKPPPVLVRFGHPTERNQLLPLSRNLKRDEGISVDKNIPKMYQQKYKDFKRLGWKMNLLHDVKTQVIFDGYNLILRYKKSDEPATQFNYVIEKEWFPQPGDAEAVMNRAPARDPNKHDTPAIDTSKQAACNKSIIITGVPESINSSNFKKEFLTYLKSRDHEAIVEISLKNKGTIVVTCKEWADCKRISDTYKTEKLLDKEIFFTLFSDVDPIALVLMPI